MNNLEKKVLISQSSSYALTALIPENKRIQKMCPITNMKAVKNEVEAQGMIQSHIEDGVALCQYFAWLENKIKKGEPVDELTGADELEKLRS